MSETRVAILTSGSLFGAGVESRLRSESGMLIQRVNTADEDAVAQLCALAPEIVILDANDVEFRAAAMIPEILNRIHSAKVFSLDLNSDEISIYVREGLPVRSVTELVAAIQG